MNTIDQSLSPAEATAPADDGPRFAVWPYLNPYIRNHEDVPAAKCYDGSEEWDLLPGIVPDDERQRRLAEQGEPFLTMEQVLEWRQGVVVAAEPERIAHCVVTTKEQLCRTHGISLEECEQRFPLVEEPNIYRIGWRPGMTTAITRVDYRPYYGPVCNLSEADGPICHHLLRRFWKYNDIETPTLDARHLIHEDFRNQEQGMDNDPRCSLGEDWRFDDIERRAYGKQGHQFEGLRFRSYQQRIAAAAYDLDEALCEVHPKAPASARASFWQSYEVHRHLCMFVRQLIEYTDTVSAKTRKSLDHPDDAFRCAQKRIMTYARRLMDDSLRIKQNQRLKPDTLSAPGNKSSRGQAPESGWNPRNFGATAVMEDSQKCRLTSNEPPGKNPFPKGDQRHEGWVAASRIARKNLMLYNAGLLDRRPAVDAPREETEGWCFEMITGRFAIMASAAVAVFGSTDEGITECERLVDHFAEFALAQGEKVIDGRTEKGSFLHDVRTKVIQYREHVMGTALGLVTANEAGPTAILRGAHTVTPVPSVGDSYDKRKRVRRNAKYEAIDEALRETAKSRPRSHEEVFQALNGRSKPPNAEPFKTAGGWHAGFKKDAVAARAWLSKAWSRLELPAFPRGPK